MRKLGLVALLPALAFAGEPAHGSWSRAEVEAALRARGMSLTLPADVRGELSTVFDAEFITLHDHGDEVWVGESPRATCSVEGLVNAAKQENGFRSIARTHETAGVAIVTSAQRTDGKDSYMVQACPVATAVLCGAEKLRDEAAARRVESLCSSLRVITAVPGDDPRVGAWVTELVDDDAKVRAAGRGGSGKRVRASVVLSRDGTAWKASYAVAVVGDKMPTTADLSGVKVRGDHFEANPIAIKAAWPLYLPHDFNGRFLGDGKLQLDGHTYQRQR
jgi:hypothetical protein